MHGQQQRTPSGTPLWGSGPALRGQQAWTTPAPIQARVCPGSVRMPRPERLLCCSTGTSPAPTAPRGLLTGRRLPSLTSVCKLSGKTWRGVEA